MTHVVVPAYNEAKTVAEVIRGLKPYADRIVVVDDGSTDRTGEIAAAAGAAVIRHCINRGLGAAIGTGVAACLCDGASFIVTFDADGQHRPEDVPRMTADLEAGRADVAIGCRVQDRERMPVTRRLANWCGNALTYALFGIWVADSQSGLRAFTRAAAEQLRIKTDRMEVSSEIVKEIKRNAWRCAEVPIVPIYTEYSMSKGQGFVVGLKTAGRLVLRRLIE